MCSPLDPGIYFSLAEKRGTKVPKGVAGNLTNKTFVILRALRGSRFALPYAQTDPLPNALPAKFVTLACDPNHSLFPHMKLL